MNAPQQIPEGYRLDARGRLIPEEQIRPIDQLRDELVLSIVDRACELRDELRDFKADVFSEIERFVETSAAEYDVQVGGKKGNVQLVSFCGRYKVVRAIQEHITFDERLQAAKGLLDECLREWTADARPEIATIVQDAFRVDSAGNIRTGQVLSLRRLDIQDSRWLRAMDAISDAVQVTGSKSYVRIYERVGDSDQYKPISLDIAGV
ncbi:conserved hypothetical protein [Thioalkalivibrio sulfidiphilus HL-EbGr7]|uniref:Sulfate transport protein CysZ n=1 Tax=Thioalkalivibrio sulfidiphilus (strain HL-EbGR7) TaxID=396588 RepID=B8GS38_THISH|nr:DUF3164 family protein [Thioalkalivibrio sulfidiphilus]ACL72742.1 conserved hypothetical protein [Thioalkalivibrio sulfidiphilus HL-EbGr7]